MQDRQVNSRRFALALAVTILILVMGPTAAQAQNSTLLGSVTDPTAAAIVGATVQASNTETGVSASAETNEFGQYVIPNLAPGTYDVNAEMSGFKRQTVSGIVLQVNQRGQLDIALELGEVTETIEVTGQAPLLETATSETGQVIENDQIVELPLNGRDFMQLALLTAGINRGGTSAWTGEELFAASGLMGDHNNYHMDGISNRENATNSLIERPSVDAVREFKAETATFNAEHQAAGLSVMVVTKSGTNSFHGSAFEFLRNDRLDAPGFFAAGRKQPALRYNQFGGTAGGPFVRNKHFWFASYEGIREGRESIRFGRIPTPAQLGGDIGQDIHDPFTGDPFPNNRVPSSQIDPVLSAIMGYYPSPNIPGAGPDANNYVNQSPLSSENDRFLARTDHNLTDDDKVYVRWSLGRFQGFRPGLIPGLSGGFKTIDPQGLAIGYQKIFSPTLFNEVRFGRTRWVNNDDAEVINSEQFRTNLGVESIGLAPGAVNELTFPHTVSPATYQSVRTGQVVIQEMNNTEVNDTATWIKGRHSIRFGGGVIRSEMRSFPLGTRQAGGGSYSGQFTGHPVADALLDVPRGVTKAGDSPITEPAVWQIGTFIQDDWRVNDRLTLNIGLRYDLHLPVNDLVLAGFDDQLGGFVFPNRVGDNPDFDVRGFYANTRPDIPIRFIDGKGVYDADTNNFSPRLGFAYALGDDRKTVIRGGGGIFFSSPGALGIRCISVVPPFTLRAQFFSDPLTPTLSLVSTGFDDAGLPPPIRVWTFPAKGGSQKFLNGYVEMWNFNIQRQISPDLMVEVGYTGNHGVKNISTIDRNQAPVPGPGNVALRRPYPGFGPVQVYSNNQFSTYHGFTLKANKRMKYGLSFLLGYTLGKAISNGDELVDGRQQDINCLACEKALAEFDLPQRFTIAYAYELPFGKGRAFGSGRPGGAGVLIDGWELGGIVTMQSGLPVTPRVTGIVGSNTGRGVRPNRICDGNLPKSSQSRERFWDRACFEAPPPFTFGTSARNILRTPGLATWDLSIKKTFFLPFWSEDAGIDFRAEMFNALNRTNFGTPNTNISDARFGQIFGECRRPAGCGHREIQLGLRLHW